MTLVDGPRIDKIKEFLFRTRRLYGVNAEVGVYKGGTAKIISETNPAKHLFLFDTFEGMPKTGPEDIHKQGDFSDTSLECVKEYLKDQPNISIHKGIFPQETGDQIYFMQFAFVHLDCDIYSSVRDSLNFFWPRMVPGGIIALDDYYEPDCPGAKSATNGFLSENNIKIFSICQSQVAITKGN